jgi:hypothetical protein
MQSIFWTGYCHHDRVAAIGEIEQIVSKYGFITDFKQFSDLSISIRMEVTETHIDSLMANLSHYIAIDEAEFASSTSSAERVVFLNITFTGGTGHLKHEIPSVPG